MEREIKGVSLLAVLLLLLVSGWSQSGDVSIKVYDFDEGLSHRNVFKVQQDTNGYIWVATINGLNRFDGYQFEWYNTESHQHRLPVNTTSDMLIDEQNQLWLAQPDYLSMLDLEKDQLELIKIKEGEIIRRESAVPNNLFQDLEKRLWMSVYDERSAQTSIKRLDDNDQLKTILEAEGRYTRRPIAQLGTDMFVAANENELWKISPDGQLRQKIHFPYEGENPATGRVVQLQASQQSLWVLLINGDLYAVDPESGEYSLHPVSNQIRNQGIATSFLIQENGDVWIGGQGMLWFYDVLTGYVNDYHDQIQKLINGNCTYRQIFADQSNVIWLATDYGLVRIVQSNDLFTQYLSGGSEYCSNTLCSIRGITEDDQGNIYLSYYNSIHRLDPTTNRLQLLFPANDFFNYPFGIIHHQDALWTGNGQRIDLKTLQVDTIFQKPNVDLGAVMADTDGLLWFGFRQWLFQYDPEKKLLTEYEDKSGKWDSLSGEISYLYQSPASDLIWIGTLSNGLFKLDKEKGRIGHYHSGKDSPVKLRHNQVNATYEDKFGRLWLATANGLHCLNLETEELKIFDSEYGLPNNFINGILSEGDTCLWVSTDNGICRFSIAAEGCVNFFEEDGISANEFNRISFFKASDGRMYFGGLNGVNAFYPDQRFWTHKERELEAPLLLTNFTRLDGGNDSLITRTHSIDKNKPIILSHRDKMFSFRFALANYQEPSKNQFSFRLDGYENTWSPTSTLRVASYHNIPAGKYVFRVRAMPDQGNWNSQELAIPIIVREAYYRTWWFWLIIGSLALGSVWSFMRYRIFLLQKREKKLEQQVYERTVELRKEKQKTEELLLNILPEETAEELKTYGVAKAKRHESVTVMFSDFKGFSRLSEHMEPEDLVAQIDHYFRAFDEIIGKYHLEKIKTIGDAYMCMCITQSENGEEPGPVRCIRAALEIQQLVNTLASEKKLRNETYFENRIGVHTGPVVAGVVGIKKFAYDIWGDTVNIAARMESSGKAGQVNVSGQTYELIKDHFRCKPSGKYTDRNAHDIDMYFVEGMG